MHMNVNAHTIDNFCVVLCAPPDGHWWPVETGTLPHSERHELVDEENAIDGQSLYHRNTEGLALTVHRCTTSPRTAPCRR